MLRVGVLWEAVEPHKNQPNATYLGEMRALIDRLGQYGIYSIVDAHQDLFSRRFCGEGAPDWVVDSGNLPNKYQFPFPIPVNLTKNSKGYPNLSECVKDLFFPDWNAALELEVAWGNFYKSNESTLAFARHWSRVAGMPFLIFDKKLMDILLSYGDLVSFCRCHEYKSICSRLRIAEWYVVSFSEQTIDMTLEASKSNAEPWPSNIYNDPLFPLIPGLADKQNLAPLYDQLYKALRRYDPNHIVFYGKLTQTSCSMDGYYE